MRSLPGNPNCLFCLIGGTELLSMYISMQQETLISTHLCPSQVLFSGHWISPDIFLW